MRIIGESIYGILAESDLTIKPMIDYFDERMDKIKASGVLSDIMERYGLENWQQFSK